MMSLPKSIQASTTSDSETTPEERRFADETTKEVAFQFDDKIVYIPRKAWPHFELVVDVVQLCNKDNEPLRISGFVAGTMHDLLIYMYQTMLPDDAMYIRNVVKLAFYLQYKYEERLCLDILGLAAANEEGEAIKAIEMLHDEGDVAALEYILRKEFFEYELDTVYGSSTFHSDPNLSICINNFIRDHLGNSKTLVNLANEYYHSRLNALFIPEDLKNYGEGMSLPHDVGHLQINGDITEITKGLEENVMKKLEKELSNLKFTNLSIHSVTEIPQFLQRGMNSTGNDTEKREVDRLWVDFEQINDIRLAVKVKRSIFLKKLKGYAHELDFSKTGSLVFYHCENKFKFNRDNLKYTHKLTVIHCGGVDILNANIGSTIKYLCLQSKSYENILLPRTIKPGLKSLFIYVDSSIDNKLEVDIREWDLSDIEVLKIYPGRVGQVAFSDAVYRIENLKSLGISRNEIDLSGAVKNTWKKLWALAVRKYQGPIVLTNTEQLKQFFLKGMVYECELTLTSSVVDGVGDINIFDTMGDVVFPKSVAGSMGKISITYCHGKTTLPECISGSIERILIGNSRGDIVFPIAIGGYIGTFELTNQNRTPIPELIVERTHILHLSESQVTMAESGGGKVSIMKKLIANSRGICLKGWFLPNLEELSGDEGILISLPPIQNMPKLKQKGTEKWMGKVQFEGQATSLEASEFKKLLV